MTLSAMSAYATKGELVTCAHGHTIATIARDLGNSPAPTPPEQIRPNPLMALAESERHKCDCCAHNVCLDCRAHISSYNANTLLIALRPEAEGWDWWIACDNADCENAYGEGLFQFDPDWVGRPS